LGHGHRGAYSCSAWIHSIYRGIDVARAAGNYHSQAPPDPASELLTPNCHGLPDAALIDMGDFAGGMLNICGRYPVARITVAEAWRR